jgi:hypothetical protein
MNRFITALCLFLAVPCFASLRWSGGTTNVITITDFAGIQAQSAGSIIFWGVKFATLGTANRRFLAKPSGGSTLNLQTANGTCANQNQFNFFVGRATTGLSVTGTTCMVTGTTYGVAFLYDNSTNPQVFISTGNGAWVDDSRTAAIGSGAFSANTGNVDLGCRTGSGCLDADMDSFMWCNTRLTQGQLNSIRYRQFLPSSSCVIWYKLGVSGTTTQVDWSGNVHNGAITSLSVSNPTYLPPAFALIQTHRLETVWVRREYGVRELQELLGA